MAKMEIPSQIVKIRNLDETDATFLKGSGNEENVKLFIIRPLLETLGYKNPKQINFEYKIDLKRADIVLLVGGKPKVLIEVKSSNQNLDNHLKQAFEYSNRIQCPYTFLTNGNDFRLYKTFIPNVISPKDRLLLDFTRAELLDKWEELFHLISHQNLISGQFDKFVDEKELEIAETVVPRVLSDHLK